MIGMLHQNPRLEELLSELVARFDDSDIPRAEGKLTDRRYETEDPKRRAGLPSRHVAAPSADGLGTH